MSLRDIHSRRRTRTNLHKVGVGEFRKKVGEGAYEEIRQWILGKFDKQEWVNTTFEAPEKWQGTALLPIWDYHIRIGDHDQRHERSALLYGAIVYTILFDEPHVYEYHRPDGHHSDDRRPFGLTYRRAD